MSKVPQNKKSFFIIEKNNNFNSIDVIFNHTEKIILENLFLIFKHFILKKEFLLQNIFVIAKTETNSKEISIFHYIKKNKMEKMNILDFYDWYEEFYINDFEYLKDKKYYGFRFCFAKESLFLETDEIFPKYPWEPNFYNLFHKKIKILKKLKAENIRMKKILKKIWYKRIT